MNPLLQVPGSLAMPRCVLIIVALVSPLVARAIGDSGGNNGCLGHDAFYAALQTGNREQIEAALNREVSPPPLPGNLWSRLLGRVEQQQPVSGASRAEKLKSLVANGPCPGQFTPINFAVAAGNPVATAYLLENGADPSALRYDGSIYHRCNQRLYSEQRPLEDPLRLAAYRLTIAHGGLVNYRNRSDETALHVCHSIPFLSLLVEGGAQVESGHLDRAIEDALRGGGTVQDNAFARVAFFASRGAVPSIEMRRKLTDPTCAIKTPEASAVCTKLNKLLRSTGRR